LRGSRRRVWLSVSKVSHAEDFYRGKRDPVSPATGAGGGIDSEIRWLPLPSCKFIAGAAPIFLLS